MLGKGSKVSNKMDTLIGQNTKLEGKIEAKGTVRLDGELVGDLVIEGSIIIGNKGVVKGNIICNNIVISGTVEGNIDCKEQLHLTNAGHINGDIKVKSFIVDENAVFEGKCKMQIDGKSSNSLNKGDKNTSSEKKSQKADKGA
ncbi:MAG: polymer-forming cytoskeletal protein [Firmicutes bacterium]|nr:polymer-forming cytoskeletal protein [Bacillota bacterium]